jgi:hypothetical protein
MTAKNKLRVFVSHASLDTPFAEKLFDNLGANGCEPWLDTQKLVAGIRWDETIREEMHNSDVIVVLLSAGAITKEGYIQREFRLALRIAEEKLSNSPFLVPICLDSCKVPTALAEYQWLDVRDLEFDLYHASALCDLHEVFFGSTERMEHRKFR